ncbi:MAG: nicotinamide riboside transporter PnuC [Saprospiraceae bacterium]|jgi:nicotinamide mononucleotide transporter|nr:nicotinamide riboside transporter PnuC [Saprospiraceae bacterium]
MESLWEWFQLIKTQAQYLRWEEWVSTITQIASVAYARKNNYLVYPTGMIGVGLAFWLYLFVASPPLYADALLNVYYFIMSMIGWYNWTQKDDHQSNAYVIRNCTRPEWISGGRVFVISWLIISLILHFLTDSNTPVMDGLVTGSAITAMWWMALRRVENWYMWIISNLAAIPLNLYKGFDLFAIMYVLFLYMSWNGAKEWNHLAAASKQKTDG